MVRHIRYCQASFHDATECLAAIQQYLDAGWWLSALEGPAGGAYTVTFGIDDDGLRLVESA